MQQTISENIIYNLFDTLGVSYSFCTPNVINHLNMKNPLVINAFDPQLVTLETIRLLNRRKRNHFNEFSTNCYSVPLKNRKHLNFSVRLQARTFSYKTDIKRKEWLAGLIDGNGSFLLSRKGYASLEITMDIRDKHALQRIKNTYGGAIKLRSGTNSLRYRLHHKSGLLFLINDVNGQIRNPNRLLQLNKVCDKYAISIFYPKELTSNNGWLSGFFDSDGTVTINKTNTQLSISLGQKTSELLVPLVKLFGGHVYIDRKEYQPFKWYITKKEDILKLLKYFKICPCRSAKINRIKLIPKFYKLKDLKAHKALPKSQLAKSWKIFYNKWLKYE